MQKKLEQVKCAEWWEDGAGFFGHGYMEGDNSYEGYLSTPLTLENRTRIEVEGVKRLLELHADQRILDCPCGYGRHSLGLARAGFQVVGVDINSEELRVAHQGIRDLTNIQFVKCDMRALDFYNEFDAAINMFFSFGFFQTDEENFQVLRNFYNALKPGGRFLMHTDVNIPQLLNGKYKFTEKRRLSSGRILQLVDSYDPQQKRINGKWTITDGENIAEDLPPYSVRVFSYEEFAEWCYRAGFKTVHGYGNWSGAQLTPDSEDMMVVAEK